MVLLALLLPMVLGLGSIVVSVGNWYVHKRHLQTQVDAAVLAAAPTFSSCFFDATTANAGIIADAVPYSGDTARAAVLSQTASNQQVQTPNNVHVVFNSTRYWQSSDGTDPTAGGTDNTNSYGGLDNTLGTPCSHSYLDAKATDDRVPLLFSWLPFFPSPKAHARVEIRQVRAQNGFLPLAVPEIDPLSVYAIFVDYANDGTKRPLFIQQLIKDTTSAACPTGAASFPYSCWVTASGQAGPVPIQQNGSSHGTGVVILVSKNSLSPSSVNPSNTLNQICNPSPNTDP